MLVKGRAWSTTILQYYTRLWFLNDAHLVQRGPNVPRKHHLHHYTNTTSLKYRYKTGWIHVFMLFIQYSDPTILLSQLKSKFSNLVLSYFCCEPVQIVASVACAFRDGILQTTEYFLFFRPSSVNPRETTPEKLSVKIPEDQQFLKYSGQTFRHQQQ